MGNNNSPEYSPEYSPNKVSKPRRISTMTKNNKTIPNQVVEKLPIIKHSSRLSKVLSKSKNIMNFITQAEELILIKNLNDSLNIGINHLNIMIANEINNPFLENQLKYYQIVDDSIDKKILGKLNYQNKEYKENEINNLINNLIEINNNDDNNNIKIDNIGNISSIHKRKGKNSSRDESQTSQRDDELDLTSFSTTIGGKNSQNCNSKNQNQNSRQIRERI